MSNIYSEQELKNFLSAIQSLKLYRRAELTEQQSDKLIIKDLYIDPLPNNSIFNSLLKPNTAFLIGRKGTGKSTIFQRVQYEILGEKNKTSSYIDIKTIYESSQINTSLLNKLEKMYHGFDRSQLEKALLYRAFIRELIIEIKNQLKRELELNFLKKFSNFFTKSIDELFKNLDKILDSANDENFKSVLGIKSISGTNTSTNDQTKTTSGSISGGHNGALPNISGKIENTNTNQKKETQNINFSDILIRHFNIKEYISSLKALLEKHEIRHLFIFIDDFSELPEDAMKIVVDTLLEPLNNWSDEFIKFKIAAYPNRIYYGKIDKTKIDEYSLDSYKLYANGDSSKEIAKGADFTKRLLTTRIEHYCKSPPEHFFKSNIDVIWNVLYETTMGNPRILGYLLSFAYETNLIYQDKIDSIAIQNAAVRYFSEKIEAYFRINKFLHESFTEKSSIYGLKELLERLLLQAKKNATNEQYSHSKQVSKPASHFHINRSFDSVLSTLELNFFLTKCQERTDRDNKEVSVYCFNYGLCKKFKIPFGQPSNQPLYFIERVFDYSPLIQEYIKNNQEIFCTKCNAVHEFSKLESIKMFEWLCPKCKTGLCKVVNLSKKYENIIKAVDDNLLLPKTELGILQTLNSENCPLFAKDVAGELDCSYQLVGKRAAKLSQKKLIKREKNQQRRTEYKISELGKNSYFSDNDREALNIEIETK